MRIGCLFSRAPHYVNSRGLGPGLVIQGEFPRSSLGAQALMIGMGSDPWGRCPAHALAPAMALSVAIGASLPGLSLGLSDHEGPRPLAFARPFPFPAPRKKPFS